MKYVSSLNLIAVLLFFGCQKTDHEANIEKWKAEIMEVEKAFNDMAQ